MSASAYLPHGDPKTATTYELGRARERAAARAQTVRACLEAVAIKDGGEFMGAMRESMEEEKADLQRLLHQLDAEIKRRAEHHRVVHHPKPARPAERISPQRPTSRSPGLVEYTAGRGTPPEGAGFRPTSPPAAAVASKE